jgi:hypothetical protein
MYVGWTIFNTKAYLIGGVAIDPAATAEAYRNAATTYSTGRTLSAESPRPGVFKQ